MILFRKKDSSRSYFSVFSLVTFSLLSLVVTATSFAYPLTATYILNKMVKGHEHVRTIEMEGKISDVKNQVTFHEVTHIDFASGKIHSLYTNEAGEVLSEKNSKLLESHPLGLAWFGLAGDSNVNQVQTILAQLGITAKDDSKVSLTRIQMRPVFEIGETATVKIDKDEFLFSGYQNDAKDALEVETFSTGGAVKLPKTITFKKMDVVIFTYELKAFKLNTPFKNNQKNAVVRAVSPAIQSWNDLVH
jgi:hypothetical protein